MDTNLQFTSFTCLNQSCSLALVTIVAEARSNLSTGVGSLQANLTIDFSPGGTSNIVDEPAVFTIDNGTISTYSAPRGLRNTRSAHRHDLPVTGGTGAFAGASGGGREFAAAAGPAPVIFNGTISF
jgi:hypothetical protein